MPKTVAFILAGGQGKRMDVLCHLRPKPALPFAGRFRVIDFTLSNCVYSGIYDLALLTDYQRTYMAKYLNQWSLSNAVSSFDILEPKSGSYRGTADAIYQNLSYLRQLNTDNTLILAGDHIYKMDYGDMLAFHERSGADVTVGVIRVPIEEAYRFGTVSVNSSADILDFVEKSKHPQSNMASMGIYVFKKDVLASRLIEDAASDSSLHDFGYSILPAMVGRDRVKAFEFSDYWQDIGTPQAYYMANMELISPQPSFSLNHYRTVLTQRLHLPPPLISHPEKAVNSLLSPGCVIKGQVFNSVLSPGVFIEEQSVVRNSVIMPNTYIGYHSVVDTCILDEGVHIGKLCYIGFGNSLLPREADITVLGKGVKVPSHTAIGRNCRVFPNLDTAGFKANFIASGSVLSQSGISRKP